MKTARVIRKSVVHPIKNTVVLRMKRMERAVSVMVASVAPAGIRQVADMRMQIVMVVFPVITDVVRLGKRHIITLLNRHTLNVVMRIKGIAPADITSKLALVPASGIVAVVALSIAKPTAMVNVSNKVAARRVEHPIVQATKAMV